MGTSGARFSSVVTRKTSPRPLVANVEPRFGGPASTSRSTIVRAVELDRAARDQRAHAVRVDVQHHLVVRAKATLLPEGEGQFLAVVVDAEGLVVPRQEMVVATDLGTQELRGVPNHPAGVGGEPVDEEGSFLARPELVAYHWRISDVAPSLSSARRRPVSVV